MLIAGDAVVADRGDAIARDPEVRQARMIAEVARVRLVACMSSPDDGVDLAQAQEMLDALRDAKAFAEDAEDRVLLHRGLLTSVEADKRTAERHRVITRSDDLEPRPGGRRCETRIIASALILALLGAVGAAFVWRWVRPLLARR